MTEPYCPTRVSGPDAVRSTAPSPLHPRAAVPRRHLTAFAAASRLNRPLLPLIKPEPSPPQPPLAPPLSPTKTLAAPLRCQRAAVSSAERAQRSAKARGVYESSCAPILVFLFLPRATGAASPAATPRHRLLPGRRLFLARRAPTNPFPPTARLAPHSLRLAPAVRRLLRRCRP